jgi:hypothetical protein
MQLDAYVHALREDLAAVASLGDEATARAAQLLAVALESALRRRLLEALTEASLELGTELEEKLGGGRVEVRLAGSDPELVVVPPEAEPAASERALTARITLRLPESLKAHVEAAAAREGVSVNTWIVNLLGRGSEARRAGTHGRRLTGYGRG